jgi:hypothetical protein
LLEPASSKNKFAGVEERPSMRFMVLEVVDVEFYALQE